MSENLGPLTGRVCTDPACTIPRKPGYPMHGPHDFIAGKPTPDHPAEDAREGLSEGERWTP